MRLPDFVRNAYYDLKAQSQLTAEQQELSSMRSIAYTAVGKGDKRDIFGLAAAYSTMSELMPHHRRHIDMSYGARIDRAMFVADSLGYHS